MPYKTITYEKLYLTQEKMYDEKIDCSDKNNNMPLQISQEHETVAYAGIGAFFTGILAHSIETSERTKLINLQYVNLATGNGMNLIPKGKTLNDVVNRTILNIMMAKVVKTMTFITAGTILLLKIPEIWRAIFSNK